MRIIAGRFRRRTLESRPGLVTRPISDFVKESLFEQIQHILPGKRVADVFAGTGTIGLEALSRGAVGAIFVEQDEKAFEFLQKNVAALKVKDETMCWKTDVFRCSFRPKNVEHLLPVDVVFFDPPYKLVESLAPGSPLFKAVERIARDDFTAPNALMVLRTPEGAAFQFPPCWEPWTELPRLDFKTMSVHIFEKRASDAVEAGGQGDGETEHEASSEDSSPG